MRIIIDAMGGDNAPQAPVLGAIRAKRELGVDVDPTTFTVEQAVPQLRALLA